VLRNISISSRYSLGDPFLSVASIFDRSYLAGAVKHTDTDDVTREEERSCNEDNSRGLCRIWTKAIPLNGNSVALRAISLRFMLELKNVFGTFSLSFSRAICAICFPSLRNEPHGEIKVARIRIRVENHLRIIVLISPRHRQPFALPYTRIWGRRSCGDNPGGSMRMADESDSSERGKNAPNSGVSLAFRRRAVSEAQFNQVRCATSTRHLKLQADLPEASALPLRLAPRIIVIHDARRS